MMLTRQCHTKTKTRTFPQEMNNDSYKSCKCNTSARSINIYVVQEHEVSKQCRNYIVKTANRDHSSYYTVHEKSNPQDNVR